LFGEFLSDLRYEGSGFDAEFGEHATHDPFRFRQEGSGEVHGGELRVASFLGQGLGCREGGLTLGGGLGLHGGYSLFWPAVRGVWNL
jgi:hypothetical protein